MKEYERLDFLKELVERVPDIAETQESVPKKKKPTQNQPHESVSEMPGSFDANSVQKDSMKPKRKSDSSSKSSKEKQTPRKKKSISVVKSVPDSPIIRAEINPKATDTSDPMCSPSLIRSQNRIVEKREVIKKQQGGNRKGPIKNFLSPNETISIEDDKQQPAHDPLPSPVEEQPDLSEIEKDTSISEDHKDPDKDNPSKVPLVKESTEDDESYLSNPIIPRNDGDDH